VIRLNHADCVPCAGHYAVRATEALVPFLQVRDFLGVHLPCVERAVLNAEAAMVAFLCIHPVYAHVNAGRPEHWLQIIPWHWRLSFGKNRYASVSNIALENVFLYIIYRYYSTKSSMIS
jgi:hypothetical protein